MVKIEHSLVIARPIDQVFVFLVNPSNNSLWQEGVIESRQISEGPVGVGTRGRDIREFFGVFRRFGDWRVGEHTARRGRLSPATRRTDAGPAAATGPAWLAHSPGA